MTEPEKCPGCGSPFRPFPYTCHDPWHSVAAEESPSAQLGFDEATEKRWQDAIYELCKKAVGPENDSLIDGGGTDSGDALDFTLAEIWQAIAFWQDKAESPSAPHDKQRIQELEAEVDRLQMAWEWQKKDMPLLAKQLSREYNFSSQGDREQAMRMGAELFNAGKASATIKTESPSAPQPTYWQKLYVECYEIRSRAEARVQALEEALSKLLDVLQSARTHQGKISMIERQAIREARELLTPKPANEAPETKN